MISRIKIPKVKKILYSVDNPEILTCQFRYWWKDKDSYLQGFKVWEGKGSKSMIMLGKYI